MGWVRHGITLALVLGSAVARADDSPGVLRVQFAATARSYAIEAAACAMPSMRVLARPLDVRIGDRRCSSSPASEDALVLVVHVEAAGDSKRIVVIEATPLDEAEAASVRVALAEARKWLEARIMDAAQPVSDVTHPRVVSARLSPALRDAGITLVVLGVVTAGIGGVGGAFVNLNDAFANGSPNQGVASALLSTLGVGVGLAVIGVPLWIIGNTTIMRVAARLSPAGASMTVAF